MTQQLINVGEGANSGTGDSIRDAFVKVNDNFNELYYNGVTGIIEQRIQDFIGNLNTSSYISTTTMNVLADLLYVSTATLTTKVGIIETNANTLTNRVATLETTVSSGLSTAGANLNAAALGLVTSLNTLTTTVTNLIIRVGNIETAATTLTTTVTNISTALNKLTTTVTNLTTALNTLTTTVTNITTRVGNIETAATTLTNTVTNLATRLGTAEGHLVPTGVIMMWSGASSAIPTGYVICNGQNGTPDLRDRFVVGAGNTYAVGATGGSNDAVIVSHSHTFTGNPLPPHNHAYHDPRWVYGTSGSGGTGDNPNGITGDTSAGTPTGTISTTGGSGTDANLPPYYALCYIMKT